jgi:hypothetical protein
MYVPFTHGCRYPMKIGRFHIVILVRAGHPSQKEQPKPAALSKGGMRFTLAFPEWALLLKSEPPSGGHSKTQAEKLFPSRPFCVLYSSVLGDWR